MADSEGPTTAWYALRRGVQRGHTLVAALGWIGGLAMLAVGISRWLYAYRSFGPLVVWRFSFHWLVLASGTLIASTIFLFWLAFKRISRVRPTPEGVQIRRGLRRSSFRWEQVHALFVSATQDRLGSRASLKLRLANNKTIKLTNSLEALPELIRSVKEFAYPRMLRGYLRLLQHGKVANFGPVTLTNHGFNWRQHNIPWQRLQSATLEGGKLTIHPLPPHGPAPFSISVHKIPNFDLCLQLTHQLQSDVKS